MHDGAFVVPGVGWMDLRWFEVSDQEAIAAAARLDAGQRTWSASRRRRVIAQVVGSAMAWAAAFLVVRMAPVYGADRTVLPADVVAGVSTVVVLFGAFLVWVRLMIWGEYPPEPGAAEARAALTATENGFAPLPPRPRLAATLVSPRYSGITANPRWGRAGLDFGNIVREWPVSPGWTYVIVTLPAPLPHVVLDATSNDGRRSDLPVDIRRHQRMSLEGDFDRWFRVWAPADYGPDALYVLTPDVMAALVDHAPGFNVEMVDDLLAFSAPDRSDWGTPEPWRALDGILERVVPKIVRASGRYRDDRALVSPAVVPPVEDRVVAEPGRRLRVRDPRKSRGRNTRLGVTYSAVLMLLYGIPGVIAMMAVLTTRY